MTPALNSKNQQSPDLRHFREFIFIGNTSNQFITKVTEQLHLASGSNLVSQGSVEDNLLIIQMHTAKEITRQLKKFNIKPGEVVKLVNKTQNGSVVISLDNKLIGMGAEIASRIVATPAV